MTVASSTDRAMFPGNGVTQIFPLPFRFFANSEIQAWLVTNATGALTALTLGTHYTLSGAGDPEVDGNPTSELTMLTAPTSLQSLFVQRVIPVTQPTDIVNQGRFFPEIHEAVFDRLTMLIQQAAGESKGAIRVAIGDPEPARLPNAISRALLLLGFDSAGNPMVVAPVSGSASDLAMNLANDTDPAKGAGQIGYDESLAYSAGSLGAAVKAANDAIGASRISVRDYESLVVSKPNPSDPGTWDWLPAIQAAVDASNSQKIDIQNASIPEIGTRSIVQPHVELPVGDGYGIYRVSNSIQAWQASGSWTSLNIAGSEGLGAFIIADNGAGGVSQAFDIISGDNAAVFPGYQSSIRNIHFIGGRNHIRLVSANIDNRKIHIKSCSHSWNNPAFHAIHIDARSTYLHIEDPRVLNCPRYLYLNHVDRAQLDGGWVNGYIDGTTGKPADSASISLNGAISAGPSRLAIRGTIFIPEPQGVTQNALTRWIDLNDDCAVDIRDAHFGLENAGYPIVFVNTPLDSVSANPFHSDARVTMDCVTGGSGTTSRVDRGLVVLRKGVTHITSLKNVSRVAGGILINSANMIDGVGTPITLAAYLAALSGSSRPMLSVTIDGVMAWDTQDVPLELRKYTSGNIPVSHPSGTFPSSSIQPASRVNGFLTSAIPDDGTLTVSFPAQFGLMIITADDGGVSTSNRVGSSVAVAYSSQAASAAVQTLWDGTFGDVAALDTDLTGVTGVDGSFTLSVKQGRVFELENRLGFSCQFRILFLNTQEY